VIVSRLNQSIHTLLCLKLASFQAGQSKNLMPDTIRAIVDFNKKRDIYNSKNKRGF